MKNIFRRIGAILLALTLCLGTSLTAFAAEDEAVRNDGISTTSTNGEITRVENTVADGEKLSLVLSSNQLYVNFKITISANGSGAYSVRMVAPDGTSQVATVYCNGGGANIPVYFAKAGEYNFHFDRTSGVSPVSATIVATN